MSNRIFKSGALAIALIAFNPYFIHAVGPSHINQGDDLEFNLPVQQPSTRRFHQGVEMRTPAFLEELPSLRSFAYCTPRVPYYPPMPSRISQDNNLTVMQRALRYTNIMWQVSKISIGGSGMIPATIIGIYAIAACVMSFEEDKPPKERIKLLAQSIAFGAVATAAMIGSAALIDNGLNGLRNA